ncbi:hypothetical protein [Trueperella bialowiezensis]|uniref:hypothetical protein n=1 Tax=Trueperella bialowiezensis TaxID=312285 RepID=UPI000F84D9E7|nr:hypothetical protein [Trueperella bialowiezensis]
MRLPYGRALADSMRRSFSTAPLPVGQLFRLRRASGYAGLGGVVGLAASSGIVAQVTARGELG